jgi:hypothetical protein
MKIKARLYVHDRLFGESVHPGLTGGCVYHVVGINDDDFRVINDSGEPLLYEKGLFDVIDPSLPDDWVTEWYEEGGVEYCRKNPPELHRPGFYEDYFDNMKYATEIFLSYCKREGLPCRSSGEESSD